MSIKNESSIPLSLAAESQESDIVTDNPWHKLRAFTDARIGLGRAGVSLPTQHLLDFQLAHAKARDAVNRPLDISSLKQSLMTRQFFSSVEPLVLQSQASNRAVYLQRPDYGRLLNQSSADLLAQHGAPKQSPYDLVIVVADGLSALAVEQNVEPFLEALSTQLAVQTKQDNWNIAPLCLVEQGRVAIGDDIAERLNAACVIVLIGERPGLSSPDSLGLYLTWDAHVGRTDAFRNCISNIRPAGMSYQDAADKACYLFNEARRLKLSGVELKDRSGDELIESENNKPGNFLI